MKPNCWDCEHFERVRLWAYCHGGKRVTKLPKNCWYSGTVKFCTYFKPKVLEKEVGEKKMRLIDAEEVKKFANSLDTLSENQLIDVLYVIANEIPTVDAVPVDYIARWMGKHQGLEYDGWNLAVGTMVADWRKENEQ